MSAGPPPAGGPVRALRSLAWPPAGAPELPWFLLTILYALSSVLLVSVPVVMAMAALYVATGIDTPTHVVWLAAYGPPAVVLVALLAWGWWRVARGLWRAARSDAPWAELRRAAHPADAAGLPALTAGVIWLIR